MAAGIVKVESEHEDGTLQVEITVLRGGLGYFRGGPLPPASDLPEDVRLALFYWLRPDLHPDAHRDDDGRWKYDGMPDYR